MTKEQLDMIMQIIEKDFKKGNIEEVKQIKKYIDAKIAERKCNLELEKIQILNKNLIKFIKEELIKEEKMGFKLNRITSYFASVKKISFLELKVYDAIGYNIEELKIKTHAPKSVEIFENVLNRYNLSLENQLTEKELEIIDPEREDKEYTKRYF